MGNSSPVPQHDEKYVDFCARTNYHNLYPDKHKAIIAKFDKFSRHSGVVFCFDKNKCTLKQYNFLQKTESDFITMKVLFGMSEMYLCYLDNEYEKEFRTMDITERDKLFSNTNFKDVFKRDDIYDGEVYGRPGINNFTDVNSKWYYISKWTLDYERRKFLDALVKTGFAYDNNSSTYKFYCTPQQLEKFICGKYADLNQEQISQLMLSNLRGNPDETDD